MSAPRQAAAPGGRARSARRGRGFSLVELLIVMVLLAVAIVPVLRAFQPALDAQSAEEAALVCRNRARGTLSRALALPFDTLDTHRGDPVDLAALFGGASGAAEETFRFRGATVTPRVAISDASGGAGGLLEVLVRVQDVTLYALRGAY